MINRCDCTIFVKPGNDDPNSPGGVAVPVPPGQRYDSPSNDLEHQDGIAIPSRPGEVFKNIDGIDLTVEPDGEIDTEVSDYVSGTLERFRRGAGQAIKGGWKDLEWLRDVHGEQEPYYHGWDALFNAVDPDNTAGCPLELP